MHWEHGLAIVEGASGVSPCPPLVLTRLTSLGTQSCHSGWVMAPDVPLGPQVLCSAWPRQGGGLWKGRERPSPVVPG